MGRKHVGYGANPAHIEILGVMIVKSIMGAVPVDDIGEEMYNKINKAFDAFFNLIVYWLKHGYTYEKNHYDEMMIT